LSDIKFAVILCLFLCRDRYLGNGDSDRREFLHDDRAIIFSPFGGDITKMWGQERGLGGPFLASQTPVFAIRL